MLTNASEIAAGSKFFSEVWGGAEDVVPVDIAIASGHAGGYFSAAYDPKGDLVAASYGFVGRFGNQSTIHSHVTASNAAGAGFALKMHQREWARNHGFDAITWTFDPLVRRNCVFNLDKLGAEAVEYLINFYGEMHDELNRGEQSDRFFAVWRTREQNQESPVASHTKAATLIRIGEGEAPVTAESINEHVEARLPFKIYLPADIEALRVSSPQVARQWRLSVRDALHPSFESGAVVRQIVDDRQALLVEWPSEGAK